MSDLTVGSVNYRRSPRDGHWEYQPYDPGPWLATKPSTSNLLDALTEAKRPWWKKLWT